MTSDNYTVSEAANDWLTKGTKTLGHGAVAGYRILAGQHLIPAIGATKLKRLTADDDVDTGRRAHRQPVHPQPASGPLDSAPVDPAGPIRDKVGRRFLLVAWP